MPGAVRVNWREDANVRTSLQTEGLAALSDPRLSNPTKMRTKCSYGRRRTWGHYSSLSLSPAHHSHTTNITLSKIKCERLYFYKEVYSFVYYVWWCFCLYLYMYTCLMDIQQQHLSPRLKGIRIRFIFLCLKRRSIWYRRNWAVFSQDLYLGRLASYR